MKKRLGAKQRRTLLIGSAIVVAGVIFGVAYSLHRAKQPNKPAAVVPKGPETPQTTASQPGSNSAASTNAQNSPTTSAPVTDQSGTSATLTVPSGQLAGSKEPPNGFTAAITQSSSSLSATCLTLAGAACVVKLTGPDGSTTHTVNPSTDDHQGNFTFNWNGTGYATGTWQVELIANKNGQSGTANIGPLSVQP